MSAEYTAVMTIDKIVPIIAAAIYMTASTMPLINFDANMAGITTNAIKINKGIIPINTIATLAHKKDPKIPFIWRQLVKNVVG